MWILVWRLWTATFLICCLPVNSCFITSMTVVHFLHQTDIGLALRKHKAIYSISPTLFSPSHSLPLMYLHFCYANRSLVSSASVVQAVLVPFLSQASIYLKISLLRSLARHDSPLFHLTVAFHLSLTFTLSSLPTSPSIPLSLGLCFPLLNCFAVDLTAMINDLKASGKQTERDTTSSPFPYKPPFFSYVNCLCVHTEHVMSSGEKDLHNTSQITREEDFICTFFLSDFCRQQPPPYRRNSFPGPLL